MQSAPTTPLQNASIFHRPGWGVVPSMLVSETHNMAVHEPRIEKPPESQDSDAFYHARRLRPRSASSAHSADSFPSCTGGWGTTNTRSLLSGLGVSRLWADTTL